VTSDRRLNRCGKCRSHKPYPLIKVPLGPPSYEDDPKAASYGLSIKDGVALYSWFCLPCTTEWCSKLSESFLTDGTVTARPEPPPPPKPSAWSKVSTWRWMTAYALAALIGALWALIKECGGN